MMTQSMTACSAPCVLIAAVDSSGFIGMCGTCHCYPLAELAAAIPSAPSPFVDSKRNRVDCLRTPPALDDRARQLTDWDCLERQWPAWHSVSDSLCMPQIKLELHSWMDCGSPGSDCLSSKTGCAPGKRLSHPDICRGLLCFCWYLQRQRSLGPTRGMQAGPMNKCWITTCVYLTCPR